MRRRQFSFPEIKKTKTRNKRRSFNSKDQVFIDIVNRLDEPLSDGRRLSLLHSVG